MAELGQDIRRLTNLAYPKAPSDVKETLAKEQFIDALVNSEMRLKIKQARPVDLNDAVRHAVELEAFYGAENKQMGQGFIHATVPSATANNQNSTEIFSTLSSRFEEMMKTMNQLLSQQQRNIKAGSQTYRPGQGNTSRPPVKNQQNFGRGNRPSVQGQRNMNKPTRRCYNCNSENHLARNCPKPKDKNNNNDKTETEEKGSVCLSSTNHAGLFVRAKLGEYGADCLVDTGATLSLISSKVWATIKGSESIERFDKGIISASGNLLDTKGKTKVCFEINDVRCVLDVVVAEMDVDAILGVDFMLKHDVIVDIDGSGGIEDSVLSVLHRLRPWICLVRRV